jgi:phage gpG-like protein
MKNKLDFSEVMNKFEHLKRDIPNVLANQSVNYFKGSFQKQGWDNTRWKTSKRVLNSGGSTLVKSGALRRSIKVVRKNFKKIIIASNLPYSKIHNEGFNGVQKVKGFTRKMKMPKRQFMGVSQKLTEMHRKTMMSMINKCFK